MTSPFHPPASRQGTLAEETGHFAIWSYALGDEFKELELMRTGAFASLRIADLTSNSGLAKGYFDRRPVTPAALIALVRFDFALYALPS